MYDSIAAGLASLQHRRLRRDRPQRAHPRLRHLEPGADLTQHPYIHTYIRHLHLSYIHTYIHKYLIAFKSTNPSIQIEPLTLGYHLKHTYIHTYLHATYIQYINTYKHVQGEYISHIAHTYYINTYIDIYIYKYLKSNTYIHTYIQKRDSSITHTYIHTYIHTVHT